MPTRSKLESRARWAQLRALWNEWDPIGVHPGSGGPLDEYDSYVGPTMRMLEGNESSPRLVEYLSWAVGEHMGMEQSGVDANHPEQFAGKLRQWFVENWATSRLSGSGDSGAA